MVEMPREARLDEGAQRGKRVYRKQRPLELAKLLIEKGLITEAEFMQKLSAERSCERR